VRVNWVKSQSVQWLGRIPEAPARRTFGVSAGGVSVATSGLIAPLLVVGVLALAIYGGVRAVGKLEARR